MKTLYLVSKTTEDVCEDMNTSFIFKVGFKHTMLKWCGIFLD